MKICLTLKFIFCGLVYVFPVDIKGQACTECKEWNGSVCKACDVGCYIVANYWCQKCLPGCYSCSSKKECDLCQTGFYGPRCTYNCSSCRGGSCSNKTCTGGCADGYYHLEEDGECLQCPNICITCNSHFDCTSCLAGHIGPNCQDCKPGYYQKHGKCIQCNTNCLHDTCFDISGKCTDGCKDGWTGWGCIDACSLNCVSCDRHNGTRCTSLDSLQISSITRGGRTKETKKYNIGIFVAVGFAVLVAAVLGVIFFMKSRGKLSECNCVNGEDGNTYGNRDGNIDDNTDGNTDDDMYPLADMTSIVYQNVDTTLSAAHSTVPILTLPTGAADIEDVLYGNLRGVPVIPFILDVDEVEDNFEDICEGDVGGGDLKAHYTALVPSQGPVYEELNKNDDIDVGDIKAQYTALNPSQGPVYEELDKNDDVDVGDNKAHYTALRQSQGPVYEELNKNDGVGFGDIKDHDVLTTSNYYNI